MGFNNEQIVRDACQVVWSEGDVSRIDEFYAEDFEAHYLRTNWGTGLQGIRALVEEIRGSFPDYREHIDELIVAGDLVTVRLTIRATHLGPLASYPATGKEVAFQDVTVLELRAGKIVSQRGLSDHFALYQQLGLIEFTPPPAAA